MVCHKAQYWDNFIFSFLFFFWNQNNKGLCKLLYIYWHSRFIFVSPQPLKLPLSKDVGQPLTAAIVPSHLAAVAAAAAAFPLRASHNPSLFLTHSLSTTLLRPAPGPIRTSHAPVLFAPYWPPNCDFGLNLTYHLSAYLIVVQLCGLLPFFVHRHARILYGSDVWNYTAIIKITNQVTMHCHHHMTHWL